MRVPQTSRGLSNPLFVVAIVVVFVFVIVIDSSKFKIQGSWLELPDPG